MSNIAPYVHRYNKAFNSGKSQYHTSRFGGHNVGLGVFLLLYHRADYSLRGPVCAYGICPYTSSHKMGKLEGSFTEPLSEPSVAFCWQHLTARCYGIPYPALNGAGRQGESRYAKSTTSGPGNRANKNSSYNQVILVMTLPIGGEVKWLVIQYGYFKLKDSWASLLAGVGGHRYQAVCLSTG